MTKDKQQLLVCVNKRFSSISCATEGAEIIYEALCEKVAQKNLDISIEKVYCFGICEKAVNVRLLGGEYWHAVTMNDIDKIIDKLSRLNKC